MSPTGLLPAKTGPVPSEATSGESGPGPNDFGPVLGYYEAGPTPREAGPRGPDAASARPGPGPNTRGPGPGASGPGRTQPEKGHKREYKFERHRLQVKAPAVTLRVGLSYSVSDTCDADPTVELSVSQDEPVQDTTADGNFSPDAKIVRDADGKISGLRLRAERKGNGDGRVYLLILSATDASGNVAKACWAVTVPKSLSKKDKDSVAAQAAAAVAAGVPLPQDSTAGPVVGPKQ